MTGRVLTRFSADLARWPSFWPQVTQFQTWPRNHQDKHIEQAARVLTRFSADLARWPSFWPQVTQFWTWPRFNRGKHFDQVSSWLVKTMTSRVLTSFSFDLTWWPRFWPQVTQYRTWPRFHRGKHSDQVSSRLGQNCDRQSVKKLIVGDERRTTTDDGHRVMTIAHPELMLRWAKKSCKISCKQSC